MSADRRRVGIIVPPAYFDTTAKELTEIDPSIDIMHTQMRLPGFAYGLDEIVDAADEIEACAVSLAATGAEVVLQLGTPFSTAHGWKGAVALRERIETSAGVPFEMMGLSVVQAVHAMGATSVAMGTGYYDAAWIDRYSAFVEDSGLRIGSAQGFADQGHFESQQAAWDASFDGFADDMLSASFGAVADEDPDAEAILVPGMPGKILGLIPDLEAAAGRPVISYFAIWWACRRRLGRPPLADHGMLLGAPTT